jgi:cell cycle sensor histidine kinase DivJ
MAAPRGVGVRVFLSDSLSRTLDAMVHPDHRDDPAQSLRHRMFIAARLSLSLAALSLAPLALAAGGVPSAPVVLAFACLMGPLGAAVLASRTGSLGKAQALHFAGMLGAIGALSASGAAPGALVWLIALPVDAGFSPQRRAPLVVAALCALLALGVALSGAPAPGFAEVALFVAPAALYVAAISSARRAGEVERHRLLAAGQARYQILADALGDLVMGVERSGSIAFASSGGAQAFGLTQRDIAGRGFFERLHVQDRPAYLAAVAQAAQGERTVTTLARLRAGAGWSEAEGPAFAWVELRCRAADDDRIGAGVIVVARDVTATHRREEELERMRAQAESASVWKDRFLANVSHELRTPLNAVIGFSDIMRDPATAIEPARRVEYSGIVHDAGQHLLAMVNSLLDVSKIEAGRFELQAEPVQITTVIDQVMEMMRLRAEQGGVALRATIDPRAGEIVADKRACRQILTNLVANAVKFTGDGGSVGVFARPEGNSVALEVVDTGCGIAGADLARLGDAFFQASSAYNRSHDGTGLGLSLVRGLVGLHGGSIAIESAPGEGTRVVVRLPLDCRAAAPGASPARIETTARRVVGFEPGQRPGAAAALELFRKAG